MNFKGRVTALALVAFVLLASTGAFATMVKKMDLGELCGNANMIFRGTVVDVTHGTIEMGGGELPTVTYRIQVDETFKGDYTDVKDGVPFVDVRMVGSVKDTPNGDVVRFTKLPELPALDQGQEYLLMTSTPGPTGLSTTVGLGQGCFSIVHHDKTEMAVNELGNQGLYDGAVTYSQLADDIRALVAE